MRSLSSLLLAGFIGAVLTLAAVAHPVVSHVDMTSVPGGTWVDISYQLDVPEGNPVQIALTISTDSGTHFTTATPSATGALGSNVLAGPSKHISWNFGVDAPGALLATTLARITATPQVPTDAELDVATLEFITRATAAGDPVVASARRGLDDFVREAKRLGFWSQLVFVPCRQGYGALHPLGGSPKRTNAKFLRKGTTTLGTDGVSMVPGTSYANRVQTPFSWNPADEPVFVSVLGHTDAGPAMSDFKPLLRYGDPTTFELLSTSHCGAPGLEILAGYRTPLAVADEFYFCDPYTTTLRRPNLGGAQFDSSHTLKALHNHYYAEKEHYSAQPGRPVGPVSFFQPTDPTQAQTIQGCLLLYGDVHALPMKDLYSLLATTLLADRAQQYFYLHLGGQSNAAPALQTRLLYSTWQDPSVGLFSISHHLYGGQYFSYWMGPNAQAPERTPAYSLAKDEWMVYRPSVKPSVWEPVYFWVQGETDTELDQTSTDYRVRLPKFTKWLREDLRPDLVVGVAQIDYAIQWRTLPEIGNFTLTGCTGAGADACGLYAIRPLLGLANANTDYSWNKGTYQLTRDAGACRRWRLQSAGVTYYLAEQDEPHPYNVVSWTPMNGATGTLVVGTSRTGRIEQVRKTQREYIITDPRSFTVDTRGLERGIDVGGNDFVHMTTQGYSDMAERFNTAYAAWRTAERQTNQATSAAIFPTGNTGYQTWASCYNLGGTAAAQLTVNKGDGLSNLVKYAFNLNPTLLDAHLMSLLGGSGLPLGKYLPMDQGGTFGLVTLQRRVDPRLSYEARFSADLRQWQIVAAPAVVETIDSTWDRVQYLAPATLRSLPHCYGLIKLRYQ